MFAFISSCIKANKEIYDYINHHLKPDDFLYHPDRGEGGDKSLNIDLYAESVFEKHLSSFGNIYSEESGFIKTSNKNQNENQKNNTIVIDPLDGSDNFMSSLPYYGTSVAMECEGEVKVGIVCNLINGIIYIRDENNILKICDLDGNLVDDFMFDTRKSKTGIFERSYSFPNVCNVLFENNLKYRSPGAVALSLASARYYNFVLFIGSLREFDLKAALYICNDLYIYEKDNLLLVSKNKKIFDELKKLLKNIRL